MSSHTRRRGASRSSISRPRQNIDRGSAAAFWLAGAIAAAVLAVFWQVRTFDFVNWDDPNYLTDNPVVQRGLSWSTMRWAVTTTHSPYWHPVTWLSHLADVAMFGMNPGAFHVTSLLLHLANTLLLFYLLRRLTRETVPSAFVAAVFGVHPLHVESVAWLAERKDVLSTFFWMLTVIAYLVYRERPEWKRYTVMIVLYAAALMSKPMVVTLPLVLLLLDIWPIGRVRVVEKLPLLAMAGATGVFTFLVQRRVGAVAGLTALPLGARVQNAIGGYVAYIGKTLWPTRLAAFYPYRLLPPVVVGSAALFLVAVTLVAVRARRSHPALLVGWLWYLVTLAPVVGLSQAGEQAMADRFTYVPMIGLLVMAAWGVRVASVPRRAVHAAAIAIVCALAVTAHAQAAYWRDSVTLWQHAIAVTAPNDVAYENLGGALRDRGQLDAALEWYRAAVDLVPTSSPVHRAILQNDIGILYNMERRSADAEAAFAQAVAVDPEFAEAQNNFANALAGGGRFADALPHYAAAVRRRADFTEARVGFGSALLSLKRAAEARRQYEEALREDPALAQAHNGLGSALAMEGDASAAMREYHEALRLDPRLPTAHFNVAVLLLKSGQTADAADHLRTALAVDPGYEPARRLLAQLR